MNVKTLMVFLYVEISTFWSLDISDIWLLEVWSHDDFQKLRLRHIVVLTFWEFRSFIILRFWYTEASTYWGLIYRGINILRFLIYCTVQCTEASKYWGFDIQRLQHFLVLIYRGFTILMFWYTETSTFSGPDILRLRHEEIQQLRFWAQIVFNIQYWRSKILLSFEILRLQLLEDSTCWG